MMNDVNTIAKRSLYPKSGGVTLAQGGSANTPSNTADMSNTVAPSNAMIPLSGALSVGLLGNPLSYWLALTVLLLGGMFVATKFGGGTTANIKFSIYNIIVVVVLGIVGGGIAKVFFTRFPVPGITPIVLAS